MRERSVLSQIRDKRMPNNRVPSQTILLTGATGILGAYLVKDLLERTQSQVYCLVRAEDAVRGRERLRAILRVYDPHDVLADAFETRVHPVLGDVSQERLGLSAEQYDALAERIETTIHVAALTNLFINYRRIEPINLGGARHIVRFCLRTPHKYLCHVSTHTVMGDKTFDKSVVFRESDLDIGQGFDHMSYQQTKFEAEKVVPARFSATRKRACTRTARRISPVCSTIFSRPSLKRVSRSTPTPILTSRRSTT
jgi:thioester reductase-like protein